MGLEGGTFIDDLVVTNPTTSDKRRQGDDHLRLLKIVLKNTFPNADGAINPSVNEFNFLVGVTSLIQDQLDAKLSIADAPGAGLSEAGGILAVEAGIGIEVTDDAVALALAGLDAFESSDINTAEDGYLVDDDGVPKRMAHTDAGLPIVTEPTDSRTLTTLDMNTYIECTSIDPTTITIPSGIGKRNNVVLVEQGGPGQVSVAGTATVNGANGLSTSRQYSVIALVCKGSSIWTLAGDSV